MGGYVSVDPERCRQLAQALRDASAAIPGKRSSITSSISGWSGTWPGTKVEALAAWLDNQAGPMFDRADLAQTAMNQPHMGPAGADTSKITIPFDITDADKANEGRQDAFDIARMVSSDDKDFASRGRTQLANALTAHKDDPAWLQAFYSNGGAASINTANKAVLGDHVPISEDGQRMLSQYAAGVAAATTMQETGKIQLPADAFKPLLDGDSVMATGVMMKFGPAGSSYGSQFLSAAGAAALQWRKDHAPRPGYSTGGIVGTGYVPSGYVEDDGDWWTKFGVSVDYISVGADDQAKGIQTIRDYDPSLLILSRVGENERASQLLVTGPDGRDHANQLVDYSWATPPGMDDSGPAAAVIRAATLDREGPFAKDSAQAAANIFDATSNRLANDGRNDNEKELYPQLPATLAQALSTMGAAYVNDLSKSTVQSTSGSSQVVIDSQTGLPVVSTNTSTINDFLTLVRQDGKAMGAFQGAVNAEMQKAALITAKFPDSPLTTGILKQVGYLNGMVAISRSDAGYDEAAAKDADNARSKAYFDAASGILAAVPGLTGAGDITKFLAASGKAIQGSSSGYLFPVNNASTYSGQAQYTINQDANDMRVFVAQGFAASGAYPTPDDATFVHDGKIAPANAQEQAAFDNWYANLPDTLDNLNDAKNGFQDAASAYAPNDNKFKNPTS